MQLENVNTFFIALSLPLADFVFFLTFFVGGNLMFIFYLGGGVWRAILIKQWL